MLGPWPEHINTHDSEPPVVAVLLWLALIASALFLVFLFAPLDLTHKNEDRIGGYVNDAVENGRWFCQFDLSGDVASKPPLYTWIAATVTRIMGRITPFALYFPSALSALLLSWSIYLAGRRYFGWRSGFLAALCLLFSPTVITHLAGARYDLLFALCVFLAAWSAFRSWTTGQEWAWFWISAALGTLAKGPFAVLLGGMGLAAVIWERRSGETTSLRGSHRSGLFLFLFITAGWLALAYAQVGRVVIDKMVLYELVTQNIADDHDRPFLGFYKPPIYFFSGFAPWSLLALIGLYRVWKQPSTRPLDRRFERFLFCWFFLALAIFCAAAHQRSRLIIPLVPPMALLAGRELDRLLYALSLRTLFRCSGAVALLVVSITFLYEFRLISQKSFVSTREMITYAEQLNSKLGTNFPLNHFESPFPFQYGLGRFRPWTSADQAMALLQGSSTVFIAIENLDRFKKHSSTNAIPFNVVDQYPRTGSPVVRIIANHPRLEWTEDMTVIFQPFSLRLRQLRPMTNRRDEFSLIAQTAEAQLEIANLSKESQSPGVTIKWKGQEASTRLTLAPGETSRVWIENAESTELQLASKKLSIASAPIFDR